MKEAILTVISALTVYLLVRGTNYPRDTLAGASKRLIRYETGLSVLIPMRLDGGSPLPASGMGDVNWTWHGKIDVRVFIGGSRSFMVGWWDEQILPEFPIFIRNASEQAIADQDGRMGWVTTTLDGAPVRLRVWPPDLDILADTAGVSPEG